MGFFYLNFFLNFGTFFYFDIFPHHEFVCLCDQTQFWQPTITEEVQSSSGFLGFFRVKISVACRQASAALSSNCSERRVFLIIQSIPKQMATGMAFSPFWGGGGGGGGGGRAGGFS